MTDPAIIAASYAAERNYSHSPDDVIDASDAVGAWGTAKESTIELVDLSGNGNVADIHGPMPAEGFIQGRRFTAANENYLDCGNDSSLDITDAITINILVRPYTNSAYHGIIGKGDYNDTFSIYFRNDGQVSAFINSINGGVLTGGSYEANVLYYLTLVYDKDAGTDNVQLFKNGVLIAYRTQTGIINTNALNLKMGMDLVGLDYYLSGDIFYGDVNNSGWSLKLIKSTFNILARLPFWSVNYEDYPDNATTYTDNLPYSSSIISSGTFKIDDDKLQCVSAGTITYSASYEFDGSEYIKVTIDGVEYAGTGTITHGNTTVSVAQDSNKVTIEMGTGDTIEGEIRIQFREEV